MSLCTTILLATSALALQPLTQRAAASRTFRDATQPATIARASLGLYGDFETTAGGSYLLEPTTSEAKGVVHFLGGAFVGAGSQLTYRYLLERFADAGYVVVATPFRLSFEYLSVCEKIEASYDAALEEAAARGYGDLDCIAVGHSCGALLHALIATRRPAERKRLALLSYNNQPAKAAIPGFDDFVKPLASEFADSQLPTTPLVRQGIAAFREQAESALDVVTDFENNPFSALRAAAPAALRELVDPLVAEGATVARQGLELADQVPDLLDEIAGGADEFEPDPTATRQLLRAKFRAEDVLVVQFENDEIDESDDVYAVLRDVAKLKESEAAQARGVEGLYGSTAPTARAPLAVRLARKPGTHLTPLTQDIFLPAERAAGLSDVELPLEAPRSAFLRDIEGTWGELEAWLG